MRISHVIRAISARWSSTFGIEDRLSLVPHITSNPFGPSGCLVATPWEGLYVEKVRSDGQPGYY